MLARASAGSMQVCVHVMLRPGGLPVRIVHHRLLLECRLVLGSVKLCKRPGADARVCAAITCNALSAPSNTPGYSYSNGQNYGSVATTSCNSGSYLSSGSLATTCTGSSQPGSWSSASAVCTGDSRVIPAPTLPMRETGLMRSLHGLFGSAVSVDCVHTEYQPRLLW